MRIKEFSEKHNCKLSTVRYYTDLGLLLPNRVSTYANYDNQCDNDMKKIMRLRSLEFSISEIGKLMTLLRFGVVLNEKEVGILHDVLTQKEKGILQQISLLNNNLKELSRLKDEIVSQIEFSEYCGIPFNMLDYIVCPVCGSTVEMNNARIVQSKIISSDLICQCSYVMKIKDGILITNESSEYLILDQYRDVEEIKDNELISPQNMLIINRIGALISETLHNIEHSKGVLFPNADSDIVMMKIYETFTDDGKYIFISSELEEVKTLMSRLESLGAKGTMLFVYAATQYPLRGIESVIDNCSNSCDMLFGRRPFTTVKLLCEKGQFKNWLSVFLTTKTLLHENEFSAYLNLNRFEEVLHQNKRSLKVELSLVK